MIATPKHVSRQGLARFSTDLSLATWAVLMSLPFVAITAAQDEARENAGDQPNREAQLAGMRRIAEGVNVTVIDDGPREVEMIAEALFRFNDPARDFSDGSIWGFGKKGRPTALLSLSLHPNNGTLGWLYEINSLSSQPVQASIPGMPNWSTRTAGLEFKPVPDAPDVAGKETARKRQLREVSARFAGFESFRKTPDAKLERYELRLLPRPIYWYSDPDAGLIDGAIFLMTYGTNPEIVLVIEVVRENEKLAWRYAMTRISYAELHVEFDKHEIWTQSHLQGTSASNPYWLFFRPTSPEEQAELESKPSK
jgi:hypothetical protein